MAVAVSLWLRDSVSSDVKGIPQTFSSWNNCMTKAYCKWPAIIGIIVASVVVLSIVWCLARCLCCGAECCCGCLSCCRSCCGSGGQRRRQPKYADQPSSPFNRAPYQGYQPTPAPQMYSGQPQFAQFDVSRTGKIHDDALPAMPSWDTASHRRVMEEHKNDDVELGTIDLARAPMLAHQAPSPRTDYPSAASLPYQQQGVQNGGDLGNPYAHDDFASHDSPYATSPTSPQRYNNTGFGSHQQSFPDHRLQRQSYSAYTPSESTRYEPSSYGQQETGVTYASRSPPPVQQPYPSLAPGGLQVGRKPVQNSWRDV